MTQTDIQPTPLSDVEHVLPCQSVTFDCDNEAVVMVWAAHRPDSCPGEASLCREHLDIYLADYTAWVRRRPLCATCMQRVEGLIEDNVRVLPL